MFIFLLGIGDIFSDFLSELEITFDFDSVNFEMNSEDALKKGGRLKNSNPNEVQGLCRINPPSRRYLLS